MPPELFTVLRDVWRDEAASKIGPGASALLAEITGRKTKTKRLKVDALVLLHRCVTYALPPPAELMECFSILLGVSEVERLNPKAKEMDAFK